MADSPLLPFINAEPGVVSFGVAPPLMVELPSVELLAGASEIDITPPPGMPKAGHSKNAQDGTGFRTRLRARVLHLRSGATSMALVAGDMHAGSSVVHRLLAEAVAADTDVPLSGLFLGATHTHAGPGQYHGCDFYNRWASNRPGFDAAYTDWLVGRLTTAVRRAFDTRRPARLAVGSTEIWGYTRNRSLAAFVANDSVSDRRTEPQRKYASINPWLHLLRVDAADGGQEPLAALAVFSIHGTGISRHDPAYNADVWAYITGELSQRIEASTGVRAVVGAVEGTHGDVTPAVRTGMLVYPEAERVGRGIGEQAAVLYGRLEAELSTDVRLASGYREIDLSTHPSIGGIVLPDPAVGVAKLAGATENNSPIVDRIPPFRAGWPKPQILAGREQGSKWVFAGALQHRINAVDTFPRVLPIQILRVGPVALLALPFEVTVEAGRRLEDSTLAALREDGVKRAIVSSAANDYWDYLTTPEEYRRQHYEGASTLYGPRTLAFVTAAAAELAAEMMRSGSVSSVARARFRFHGRRYLPLSTGKPVHPTMVEAPRFFEATIREDAYWETTWLDSAPGDLDWTEPILSVQTNEGDTWVPLADDQGWRIGITHLGPTGPAHRYAGRWYGPPLGRPGRYRFNLRGEVPGQGFD